MGSLKVENDDQAPQALFLSVSPAGIFEGWLTYCGGSGEAEANLGK